MALVCPNCGVATAFMPERIEDQRAMLVDSSDDRSIVYGRARVSAITDYINQIRYAICVCANCTNYFLVKQVRYVDEDWVVVYPTPHKSAPQEVPEPTKSELEEAELCFAIGTYRASVAMCQIALEALWRDKAVSSLDKLKESGIISQTLHDRANEIRKWANITKHELIIDPVSREDAEQLLTYLKAILNAVYVEPKHFDTLKQKREQLKKG